MGKFGDLKQRKKSSPSSIDDFIDGADKYQNKSNQELPIEKAPIERLNVEIPKTLHKSVKIRAVEEGTKIREVVIKALNDYLNK